jgi:hypothetical protein
VGRADCAAEDAGTEACAAKACASERGVSRIIPAIFFEWVGQASLPALQVVAEVGKACATGTEACATGTEACATGTEACATGTEACATTGGARQTGPGSLSRAVAATEGCSRTAVATRPAVVGARPIPRPGGW